MKKIFFSMIVILCCLPLYGIAQQRQLHISVQGDEVFFIKEIKYKNTYEDTAELNKTLTRILLHLYDAGYLAASFEEIKTDTAGTKAVLFTGKQYQWAILDKGNVNEGWLSEIGYRDRLFTGKAFQPEQVNKLLEKILAFAENNGYPFAQVKLDSISINEEKVFARINIDKGHLISWDTISILGDSSISVSFLSAYLDIKPGKPYNESQAGKIESRLKELLYISLKARPQVSFIKEKAVPVLYLEEQRASRLNGVLGLAPNSSKQNKFLVTGEIELELINIGGLGIRGELGYKNFLGSASQIHLGASFPYILSTKFGVNGQFNMTYFDTAYYILNNHFGINYFFSGNNSLQIFIENYISRLTMPETYKELNITPPFLDVSTVWYGLGINKEVLDYKLNPRKGYTIWLEGSAGIKNITKNTVLDEQLYDSLELKKMVYKLRSEAGAFIPLGRRSTIGLNLQATLLADDEILENQLFRIGGIRTLRGFDEESIFASSYYIPRLEYRFLTDENSNLQVFANAAYYQKRLRRSQHEDFPVGFGAGYNYLTKLGMFSIIFAVGRQQNNPIDFNAAKIHVGYLNRF